MANGSVKHDLQLKIDEYTRTTDSEYGQFYLAHAWGNTYGISVKCDDVNNIFIVPSTGGVTSAKVFTVNETTTTGDNHIRFVKGKTVTIRQIYI